MADDVFDDEASEMSIIEREWNKISSKRTKAAFVAGCTSGEESTLQDGFNNGFKHGFVSSFLLSKIKGVLKALMAYRACYEGHPITDDVIIEAELLLEDVACLEADSVAEDFISMKINPPCSCMQRSADELDVSGLKMDVDEGKCNVDGGCSSATFCNAHAHTSSQPHTCQCDRGCKGFRDSDNTNLNVTLDEMNRLLLSCPQIADAVVRCKNILKRLKWTDRMIDRLF